MEHRTNKIYAIILVGGKGKRLKPLSTNTRPKVFLSVTKDRKTMFKTTVDRIRKIIPPKNILVVANRAHLRLVKEDFPDIDKRNLILEPLSRNTAPAIALAAALLKKRAKDAIMVILPADQYVLDEQKYLSTIKKGIEFAKGHDALIVLALRPTYPSTEFGYVKVRSKELGVGSIYKVEKFVEKPRLKMAKRFLKDKDRGYLWNAGAFIFRADSILEAVKQFAPTIFNGLRQLDNKNINIVYKNFPDISIDYAVMEKANNIYCVKGTYRWRDIGSFEALKKILKREKRSFVEKRGKITQIKN